MINDGLERANDLFIIIIQSTGADRIQIEVA